MQSCLYEGTVRHRRFSPREHSFSYPLFLVYLDLDELDTVFRGRWFWSTRRLALARFRREDHLGPAGQALSESVRDVVENDGAPRPLGPIRLLTHLRYGGIAMNPVSFYYCYDVDGETLLAIVAEVNNTPWGERHCYVLRVAPSDPQTSTTPLTFQHPKDFHVSPFMDMNMDYHWRITRPSESLAVHIQNERVGQKLFDATLVLKRRPINGPQLARVLIEYPLLTLRVLVAIYWQAWRLWLKKIPFVPHPQTQRPLESLS
jgi:DUF1365 family protein